MRYSHLFCQTLRESPAEAESDSHRLLERGGFLRTLPPGSPALLPLGWRVIRNLQAIVREEMERIGAQEIHLPESRGVPAEQGDAFPPGREAMLAELARRTIRSYRQLPVSLYFFDRETAEESARRSWLISTRESLAARLYSFHADLADLDRFCAEVRQALLAIFSRCGLSPLVAVCDTEPAGEAAAHAFAVPSDAGDETFLVCPSGDYAATQEVAQFAREALPQEPPLPMEEVRTPECRTIEALSQFLGIPKARTAKAAFFVADGRFLFVVVRGDMAVSETKLARLVAASSLRPATPEEIRAVGAVPGYASPVGLRDVQVVADDLVPRSPNLVAGANREGYHLRNVNYGRDFTATTVGDVARAKEGDPCPHCGSPLRAARGATIGSIRRLGVRYSEPVRATYLDPTGRARPVAMGSCRVDLLQTMAGVVESFHDEKGILWPVGLAPYQVHLLAIGAGTPEVAAVADRLYGDLQASGLEALFDDRVESPGVKFGDADLIGPPLRLAVSPRGLAKGEVELKARRDGQAISIPPESVVAEVRRQLDRLR